MEAKVRLRLSQIRCYSAWFIKVICTFIYSGRLHSNCMRLGSFQSSCWNFYQSHSPECCFHYPAFKWDRLTVECFSKFSSFSLDGMVKWLEESYYSQKSEEDYTYHYSMPKWFQICSGKSCFSEALLFKQGFSCF